MITFRRYLIPFSWLYGLGVNIRNRLFNAGILKEKEYDLPIICVGNITVGGTGKTPHTEYLIRLLKPDYKIAVLSRGYKRNTRGFILADEKSTPKTIGDEPYQIYNKFPDVLVAVDENRNRAIENLLNLNKERVPDVILLDDALQYRYVKAGFNILLTDFRRPIYEDKLLPAGLLREPVKAKTRANAVIVTKCPEEILPIDFRIAEKHLDLYPYQQLFFTSFEYLKLKPLFSKELKEQDLSILNKEVSVLLVTGIASSKYLYNMLLSFGCKVEHLNYPDHYSYTKADVEKIDKAYNKLDSDKKIIIVTEKDAVKFINNKLQNKNLEESGYYLPIDVRFLQDKKADFDRIIRTYVEENKRNNSIS